ncbi:hypothetical protein [Reyranella massiliensis]|uniref:hypothetical protein n=1 Tax=Reyranella massiliensis TaxID=445220 RepID=UPI0005C297D0|nr:hypothetical protein [Reyranella massiliensis]
MADNYPATAGFKSLGASEIAARIVDRDPERRLNTMISITLVALIGTPMVGDEIALTIHEGVLYVRPRISELVALGILVKGPTRPASICGRMASVLQPSNDLLDLIERRGIQLDGSDDDALWAAVGSIILARLEAAKHQRM